MIRFLIHRPIAVITVILALGIFGMIATTQLPVSLLPDVKIPEVTVFVHHDSYSGREFHQSITSNLMRQLRQCTRLKDIKSETEDGKATLKLTYEYGTDPNLAALEVNERIDRAMGNFPNDMERPKVVKASLTDIPAFYIDLTLKQQGDTKNFTELGELAENIIRKHIEQLPQVAFVDITGAEKPEILISLDESKIHTLGIDPSLIEETFTNNNLQFGAVEVPDGNYQYQIRFETRVVSLEAIKGLHLNIDGKIIRIGEIASVKKISAKPKGTFASRGKQAISLAVIKQPDARMGDLNTEVRKILSVLGRQFPQIHFEVTQDQTKLLAYAMDNLEISLALGLILAMAVVFGFMSNWKLSLLIGVAVPLSVSISLFFFEVFGLSLNMLSLSGLILGLGMMIDNAIIVIDNISQFGERKLGLEEACTRGTNEVIRPLLSSVMTTCAVFVPLIFLSGLAGGLFYDQAMAVTIGLAISFSVSITLLPCLYFLFFRKKGLPINPSGQGFSFMNGITKVYDKVFAAFFSHKLAAGLGFLSIALLGAWLYTTIEKERFPSFEKSDAIISITWNEAIDLFQITQRVNEIITPVESGLLQYHVWSGIQDYHINKGFDMAKTESKIYLEAQNHLQLQKIQDKIAQHLSTAYAKTSFDFLPADNLFDNTFNRAQSDFEVRIYPNDLSGDFEEVAHWVEHLKSKKSIFTKTAWASQSDSIKNTAQSHYLDYLSVSFNTEQLILYQVSARQLANYLRTQLNSFQIGHLNLAPRMIPIIVGGQNLGLEEIIQSGMVINDMGVPIPIRKLVQVEMKHDFKKITSGLEGEYVPIGFGLDNIGLETAEQYLRSQFKALNLPFKFTFHGTAYQSKVIINELSWVLLVAILLLFFVLTAQFESLLQPLIILVEIPIDIGGVLLMLYLFGESLNVMSAIGIIVMSGIIINDSILKIDTYNRLIRQEGLGLMTALKVAGKRRLRPIIMTSLTTILAMVPFLFGKGLGVELQRPLAVAVIGGLGLGTLVSIYFIPLMYWWLYRNKFPKKQPVLDNSPLSN